MYFILFQNGITGISKYGEYFGIALHEDFNPDIKEDLFYLIIIQNEICMQ